MGTFEPKDDQGKSLGRAFEIWTPSGSVFDPNPPPAEPNTSKPPAKADSTGKEMSYEEVKALTDALMKASGVFVRSEKLLGTTKDKAPPYWSSTSPTKPGRR